MRKGHVKTAVIVIATGIFSCCHADIWTDTVIKDGDDYDYLYVHDSPPANTLVSMIGGSVYDLFALDASTITITAGRVTDLYAKNESTVNINGGTIGDVMSYDSSTVNITGGEIPNGLQSGGSSRVNVSGGIIGSFVCATHNSLLNISGGRIEDYLLAYDSSTVNIYGTNLQYDPDSTVPNPWGPGRWEGGKITGNWTNGAPFEINLVDNLGGTGSNNTFSRVVLNQVVVPVVLYVDADAHGAEDGSSWANAFTALQDALAAAKGTDEIRVAGGVYCPDRGAGITSGDRSATFQLKKAVAVRGGYAGLGAPNPDQRDIHAYETILSGDLKGDDAPITDTAELTEDPTRNDNSQHVITVSGYIEGADAPVLEGFTITGGNATYSGGGLMVDYSDVIVKDCTFVNNSAEYNGGAMAFWNGRVIFKRCAFIGNAAVKNGGAIHTDGCDTCRGSYLLLENCTFLDNHAWIYGGAVSNRSTSITSLVNCLVAGNYAAGSGGGLYDHGYYGCRLTNCTLVGNAETAVTFARRKSVMTNCIVWDNRMGTGMNDVHQIYVEEGVPAPDI
ncbi:MAG: hypothetical protein JSU94_21785, partial [Phycisphaerales bacterium]